MAQGEWHWREVGLRGGEGEKESGTVGGVTQGEWHWRGGAQKKGVALEGVGLRREEGVALERVELRGEDSIDFTVQESNIGKLLTLYLYTLELSVFNVKRPLATQSILSKSVIDLEGVFDTIKLTTIPHIFGR